MGSPDETWMPTKVASHLQNYDSFSMASNVIINANSGDLAKC